MLGITKTLLQVEQVVLASLNSSGWMAVFIGWVIVRIPERDASSESLKKDSEDSEEPEDSEERLLLDLLSPLDHLDLQVAFTSFLAFRLLDLAAFSTISASSNNSSISPSR